MVDIAGDVLGPKSVCLFCKKDTRSTGIQSTPTVISQEVQASPTVRSQGTQCGLSTLITPHSDDTIRTDHFCFDDEGNMRHHFMHVSKGISLYLLIMLIFSNQRTLYTINSASLHLICFVFCSDINFKIY